METVRLNLPMMYGDHHVIEVRRVLFELDGVEDINASSCFQIVEVNFDPARTDADAIKNYLEKAGYFEDMLIPVETGEPAYVEGLTNKNNFFRHTESYAQTSKAISFAQNVSYVGRALWPCPGMGVVDRNTEMEEE